jgi:hypothetical protein
MVHFTKRMRVKEMRASSGRQNPKGEAKGNGNGKGSVLETGKTGNGRGWSVVPE